MKSPDHRVRPSGEHLTNSVVLLYSKEKEQEFSMEEGGNRNSHAEQHSAQKTAGFPEFRQFFEATTDGILLMDARSGEIIDVNPAFTQIAGYAHDFLIGKKIRDIGPLRKIDEQFNISGALQRRDRISFDDLPLSSREGEVRIELTGSVYPVDGSRIIQWCVRDVTDRKRILEALRRSEEQFRLLFEDNPHPMWIYDNRSFSFLAVNDAAVQTYGYSRKEFLSMTIKDVHLPDDVSDFLKTRHHIREPRLKPDVWRHRKKNGEIIEVEMTSHDIIFNNRNALFVIITDVTMRKQAEQLSKETLQMLQDVLNALPVGVWITDQRGNIIMGNPASKRIWGGVRYVGPERYGEYKGWWAETGKRVEAHEWAAARAASKGESSLNEVINIEAFDGTRRTIRNSAVPLLDSRRNIRGALVLIEDITERRRQEEELMRIHTILERQATTDTLVGIYNRLKFNEVLEREVKEAMRYEEPLSVMMFDIDHFKLINDTYGHLTGDSVLKEIAQLVSKNIRSVDIFARWGGEEFIILSPNNRRHDAQILAEKLRVLIQNFHYSCACMVTCSFGVTEFQKEDTVDSFVMRVDSALYKAKERGRNRVEIE